MFWAARYTKVAGVEDVDEPEGEMRRLLGILGAVSIRQGAKLTIVEHY